VRYQLTPCCSRPSQRGNMNSPTVSRSLGRTTFAAVVMGSGAMLRGWMVLYPSRHIGFTGSPLLIGFEAVKATALLLVLSWVYIKNTKEEDRVIRANNVYLFGAAASLSIIIDVSISISKHY
jgi:hypothetical protein